MSFEFQVLAMCTKTIGIGRSGAEPADEFGVEIKALELGLNFIGSDVSRNSSKKDLDVAFFGEAERMEIDLVFSQEFLNKTEVSDVGGYDGYLAIGGLCSDGGWVEIRKFKYGRRNLASGRGAEDYGRRFRSVYGLLGGCSVGGGGR